MKSVGEAMGIGRTFAEAFLKAMRSRELDAGAATPWPSVDDLPAGIHPWFRAQLERARSALCSTRTKSDLVASDWIRLKSAGWSDRDLGDAWNTSEEEVRAARVAWGVRPTYRRVDSCAAEVEAASNYLYSTWGEEDEVRPEGRSVVILGSGPNRIGQGIEFDYCCVHAAKTFRSLGYEAVMVNCNPETVSTDYDTSDRLYFEPLGEEEVLEICARERPRGVVIQFGGQTPLKLARTLEDAGYAILGTPFGAVDLAEDRERFAALCGELGIDVPPWGAAARQTDAIGIAEEIGYPVLVRPSYVLGGRNMRVCYSAEEVGAAAADAGRVLVDRFLEGAVEIDVDALCADALARVEATVRRLAPALGVVGLVNVQLALVDDELYVLEANPRASRTVPFASKAIGVNLVDAACRLAAGARLSDLALGASDSNGHVSVKAAVFPFARFPGADPVLGPEMRSTGEVMASAADFPSAFAKAERAAGRPLPDGGTAFLSVRDADKDAAVGLGRRLIDLGFELCATAGTAHALAAAGLPVTSVRKVGEDNGGATVVDLVRRRRCDLVVNTPAGRGARSDGYLIREAALVARIPCITTLAGAFAAIEAIARARNEDAVSLQERVAKRTA
jgi:carbamoyl-phosphate synthase large subunit